MIPPINKYPDVSGRFVAGKFTWVEAVKRCLGYRFYDRLDSSKARDFTFRIGFELYELRRSTVHIPNVIMVYMIVEYLKKYAGRDEVRLFQLNHVHIKQNESIQCYEVTLNCRYILVRKYPENMYVPS